MGWNPVKSVVGGIGKTVAGTVDVVTGHPMKGLTEMGTGLLDAATLGLSDVIGGVLNPKMQSYAPDPQNEAFIAQMQQQMTQQGPSLGSQQISQQYLPQALAQNQALLASQRSGPAAIRNKMLADAQIRQQAQQQMQESDVMSRLQARTMLGQALGQQLGISTAQDVATMQQGLLRQQMFAGLLGATGQGIGSYASASSRQQQQPTQFGSAAAGNIGQTDMYFGSPYNPNQSYMA